MRTNISDLFGYTYASEESGKGAIFNRSKFKLFILLT